MRAVAMTLRPRWADSRARAAPISLLHPVMSTVYRRWLLGIVKFDDVERSDDGKDIGGDLKVNLLRHEYNALSLQNAHRLHP